MDLLAKAKCLIGLHHRDGRRVARRGSLYHAPCQHCGTPLQKVVDGKWQRL